MSVHNGIIAAMPGAPSSFLLLRVCQTMEIAILKKHVKFALWPGAPSFAKPNSFMRLREGGRTARKA